MKKPMNDIVDLHEKHGDKGMEQLTDPSRDIPAGEYFPQSGEAIDTGPRFLSLRELLDGTDEEEAFLVENILPSVGLSAIVGIPDGGKSQFTRHLAFAIVSEADFLGLKVRPKYRRVIIVLTEESKGQVRKAVKRQMENLLDAVIPEESIEFLPANSLTPDEVIEALTERLREAPADLVIVDSFGDMFPGRDPNSTAEMRKALKPFDGIAQRFSVAVLFVNHVGKAGYRTAPDQSQVINSAAFVQKCRSVIDLRYEPADPLTKFLSITKANGVSTEVKRRAMVLRFDESSLLFTFTGLYKPVSEINADPADMERAQHRQEAIKRRRDGESIRAIAESMSISKTTVGEWVKGVRPSETPRDRTAGQPDSDEDPDPSGVSGDLSGAGH